MDSEFLRSAEEGRPAADGKALQNHGDGFPDRLRRPTGPDGSPVPPTADRIEDVRDRLRDPAAARDILDLDGFHPRVQDVVLNTPGARELLANLADYADLPAGPRRIANGCAGGRHRASGLTELLARELRDCGLEVAVEHLHVHLPRVLKASGSTSTGAGA
ncbi:RapZ C-terminal domain-containing protein [Streptomyces sp. NBC_01477]|uniref:RapZ C-terminal domain-containing protein n=1 Tax=Streptomyces sp. NBC_01477 TaxID=2976015 RepID=UPI002E314491|nr:hypothetical protein [Streptomyces sp. NBC_01477]